MSPKPSAYQLKISLKYMEEPVWRTIAVPAAITFAKLHLVIQAAMGWEDYHLHQFMVGKQIFGEPDEDMGFGGPKIYSEKSNKLNKAVTQKKAKFIYEYDFGDSWLHDILVEKIIPGFSGGKLPQCLAGGGACPPEDCGGPPGYQDLLEAVANPDHSEHEDALDWLGEDFDPKAFDLKAVNKALAKL